MTQPSETLEPPAQRPDPAAPGARPPSLAMSPQRRTVLAALAATPIWARAQESAAGSPLRLAQSVGLTGPLADLGTAVHLGAKACFEQVNAKGGVEGRPIELLVRDDAYDLKRSQANVDQFLADRSVLALFNCFGTPMVESLLPKAQEAGMPVFAPYSGASSVRKGNPRSVVHIRASYADEVERIVDHLATVGHRKVAVAHQANSFGAEVAESAKAALAQRKMNATLVLPVESDASNAADVAGRLLASDPEVVIAGLAGRPALELIKAVHGRRRNVAVYALSVMGTATTIKALGAEGAGVAVSQVMPMPSNTVAPLMREFQAAWAALGTDQPLSHTALEGYVNARAMVEALRRAGRNPTRTALVDAFWKIRRLDLGGLELNFSEPGTSASRFVEMTVIGRDGRLMR